MSQWQINFAANRMLQGGVIAYPTEAVWGLGCDPNNVSAVSRILQLKQRPHHKGMILIAANSSQLEQYLDGLDQQLIDKLQKSWPGPNTWLVPDNGTAPYWIKGDFNSVALRVTDHPIAQALCESFGGPIVSTSANLSGLSACQQRLQVERFFGDALDYIVPGKVSHYNKPSTIKDVLTDQVIR